MALPVKAREAVARAHAKAREATAGRGLMASGATLAGAVLAGAIDSKFGVAGSSYPATYIGIAGAVGGIALKQPMLVNASVGMLTPAAYRWGTQLPAMLMPSTTTTTPPATSTTGH